MPFEWQPELEKLDEVPETYRGLYAKKDGAEGEAPKFTLDGDLAKRLDTSALANTLKKERDIGKELKNQLAGFTKLGKAPEDVERQLADLRAELAEARKGKEGAEAWEKQRTTLESNHTKTLGEKDAEVKRLTSVLHTRIAESAVRDALVKNEGAVDLLLPIVAPNVTLVEEDGEFLVRITDEKGNPRDSKSGSPMTVEEYVLELKKDPRFARAFKGTGSSGGGTPPGTNSGGIPGSTKLTPLDRISKGLKK